MKQEKEVCVITGGGSGMGFATAKRLGKKGIHLILVGRTVSKLEHAAEELNSMGIDAEVCACDLSDWYSVQALAALAASRGIVTTVIHAAGMSPHMGDAKKIMQGNALGTIHIHDAFYDVIAEGGCLIDTSSMSAYMVPTFIMPKRFFKYSQTDRDKFMKKMMARVNLFPEKVRAGVAYGVSKYFVIWYAKAEASRFGAKGIRILSITPGNFETPMGELEKSEAETYLKHNAIKRLGQPDEIAALFEACADSSMGYLTGVDIICDGGCVAGGASAWNR
ncbi:MAG: SDR family oxidoreductase [Anaerofustis sp.]